MKDLKDWNNTPEPIYNIVMIAEEGSEVLSEMIGGSTTLALAGEVRDLVAAFLAWSDCRESRNTLYNTQPVSYELTDLVNSLLATTKVVSKIIRFGDTKSPDHHNRQLRIAELHDQVSLILAYARQALSDDMWIRAFDKKAVVSRMAVSRSLYSGGVWTDTPI